jgi:isopentenyldiphosphate isomerase
MLLRLNEKLDVYIFLTDDEIQVTWRATTRGPYELIWKVSITHPRSLEMLSDFLRELPNELAKIDPARFAIDPVSPP